MIAASANRALMTRMVCHRHETGSALIATLGIAAFLAALAVLVIHMMVATAHLARDHRVAIEADAAFDQAFAHTLWRLRADGPPSNFGAPFEVEVNGASLRATIFSPGGLIDINHASLQVLGPSLAKAGASDPASLAAAIMDWRDSDDLVNLRGAERPQYEALGRPGPANRAFEATVELENVLGMTPDVFDCLIEHVTVSSLASAPDLALSSDWVRQALLGEGVTASSLSVPVNPGSGDLIGVTLEMLDGPQAGQRARILVRLTGIREEPYWIQAWDQSASPARGCEANS